MSAVESGGCMGVSATAAISLLLLLQPVERALRDTDEVYREGFLKNSSASSRKQRSISASEQGIQPGKPMAAGRPSPHYLTPD